MHEHGKSWINVAKGLTNRNSLQCRTHGQKYLQSLENLMKILIQHLKTGSTLKDEQYLKIKKYEEDCIKVIQLIKSEGKGKQMRQELFPSHLFLPQFGEKGDFKEKLRSIILAIKNELNHYNQMKMEKREENVFKKRKRI